jgi:molybdenum cofactor cytidylyltransferase
MGRPKQLLPFRGKTLLECVVDSALRSTLANVVVVLGHQAAELYRLLASRDVCVVINADYRQGQGSSVRSGLQQVREEAAAVLFLLGDQPLVAAETIDSLVAAYRQSAAPIIQPVFEGRRGNPVLFGKETFPYLAALGDGQNARSVFEVFAGRIRSLPVADPYIHFDVDTAEDYQKLQQLESVRPSQPRPVSAPADTSPTTDFQIVPGEFNRGE